jgi:hypothetical protein
MGNLDEQLGLDQMSVEQVQQIERKGERPTFLTVICVLSFIGNGLGLFQGTMGLLMVGIWNQMFKALSKSSKGMGQAQAEVENIFNSITWFSMMFIVASALCLVGAILMWKLKKSGFILYVLGQCLPVLGTLFLFGFMFSGPAVGFGVMISIFSAIFPIAFVIMYGLNLKHLK